MAAADQPHQLFRNVIRQNVMQGHAFDLRRMMSPREISEGTVGLYDAKFRVQSDDAIGDGFEDRLQFAAASLEGKVCSGEFGSRALRERTALFKVGGHVVERVDEFAEFLRGALRNTVLVVSCRNFAHRICQGFNGTRAVSYTHLT